MADRLKAFEHLLSNNALQQGSVSSPMQTVPAPVTFPQETPAFMPTTLPTPSGPDPPGMIQVPDDMKRILAAQSAVGRPYPVPQQPFHGNPVFVRQQIIQQQQQQAMNQGRWQHAGPYFGKLMVGSLAGLMILEAVRESEQSNDSPAGRGLFAMPVHLLKAAATSTHFTVAGLEISTAQVIAHLKLLLLFAALLWLVAPSVFEAKPPRSFKSQQSQAAVTAAPSLASPLHVRRQAWLTAIQTVWVPRHNFLLEAAALILKTMKLSIRNTIGVHGYQMLTGLTEEQEMARVKSWTIALDAQLAGGDREINGSRLTLTLLASWTLPNSPLRFMLKALHIRILLRQLGNNPAANWVAAEWARANWNSAKQLHGIQKLRRNSGEFNDEDLPEHLSILLDQECDDVLVDDIIQRAHNLAWDRPTMYGIATDIEGMDGIVDDAAVRSPMDAVAAWWSSMTLHRALSTSVASETETPEIAASISDDIELAISVAPIGSNAQLRAMVARAVLVDEDREGSISAAEMAQELNESDPQHDSPLGAASTGTTDPDLAMAMRCASAISYLSHYASPDETVLTNIQAVMPDPSRPASLLSCAAAFKLMNALHTNSAYAEACATALEAFTGGLRVLVGSAASGDGSGLTEDVKHCMVDRCIAITKSIVGMTDDDTGYGSMSDCEVEENGSC
jgi:hypothetical protein